jgi:PmbA protein
MDFDKLKDRLGKAFDSYEVFFMKEKMRKYETKDAELSGVEIKNEEGIALRAIKDNRMVFSYSFDKGDRAIDALVENGTVLLSTTERDEMAGFPGRYGDYPALDIYDSQSLRVSDDEKVAMLMGMEKTIIDYDKRIVATRNCELQQDDIYVRMINSSGLDVEGRKALFTVFALAVAKEDDEVSWSDWVWAHRLGEIDPIALGAKVAQKTISFLSAGQLDTGLYEGILTPQAAADMLGILGGSFLAESLYKEKTKLKNRVGEKVFSERLNIKDSGIAGMVGFPFDGEGVPSGETSVVADGCFKTFLYDTYYGRRFNRESTGNSVRGGVKDLPKCESRSLFIEPGSRDIAGELTKGIVIEELMGTHTANEVTGDFSLGAVGYLCRDGKKSPFQGVIFSGNVFELLNSVKEVGNDLRFYGGVGSPSLYVEGLKISGK